MTCSHWAYSLHAAGNGRRAPPVPGLTILGRAAGVKVAALPKRVADRAPGYWAFDFSPERSLWVSGTANSRERNPVSVFTALILADAAG